MAKSNKKNTKQSRSQTRQETIERHEQMSRKILKLKVKSDSRHKREYLRRLFLEAKWDVNHIVHMRKLGLGWSKPGNQKKVPSLSKARRLARKAGFIDDRGCAMLNEVSFKFSKRSPSGLEHTVKA